MIACGLSDEKTEQLIPLSMRGSMPELLRQLQEFEWAYGSEAEEKMEALAGEMVSTLEHTEKSQRDQELKLLLHEGHWPGAIDRDEVLAHLEERLSVLSRLLDRPEDNILRELERERDRLTQQILLEHPEAAAYIAGHRAELEEHFRKHYPEAAKHISEMRAKQTREKDEVTS